MLRHKLGVTRFNWVLIGLLLLAVQPNVSAKQSTLTFRAPDPGPVGDAVKEILEEAYQELGISMQYVDMPRNRSLVEANNGRISGELGRLPDLEARYNNLQRVPFELFAFETVLVADRRDCGLCTLDDVENLAFVSGMQTILQALENANFKRPSVQAIDINQLHLMFSNRRVQAVLMNDFEARQLGYYDEPHLIITPIRQQLGYHYLHQKHAHLIEPLAEILEVMHDRGRVTDIYRAYGVRFQRTNAFEQPPFFSQISATAGLWRTLTHVDGSGRYWQLVKRIFEPVTDSLTLNTNSYQRAVLGLNEQRFDFLVGGVKNQASIQGIESLTHLDYDRDLYAFTMDQAAMDALLEGELKLPVCYVAGYGYHALFKGEMVFYQADSSLDCFAMLDMGRMGAVVNYRENMPDWIATPYVQHKLRAAVPVHLIFHDTPRGRELRDWFDYRMRQLVKSGEIQEVFTDTMLERSHLIKNVPQD
ncbi:hypothetical protein [Pseudidiomarina woesei]|uniref:Uncharacterized protein n=1 Tax=Pseudidiomarina woesei TaxID=1381080 RepID=A0A0K6H4J7_9GAMM|nr:hypothetical protein [Pseudidiomarina woesei]CUA85918.1 hypothetical protein Ga0061064_1357 [Pseudidiomarina woesei]